MRYDLEKMFQEIEKCIRELSGVRPIGDTDVYHMIVSIRRGSPSSPQSWTYEVTISMSDIIDPVYDHPGAPRIKCRGTGIIFEEALAHLLVELLGNVQIKTLGIARCP